MDSGDILGDRKSYIIIEEKGQNNKRPWTAASFNTSPIHTVDKLGVLLFFCIWYG